LTEFCQVVGCHRKSAIRLLNRLARPTPAGAHFTPLADVSAAP